MADLLAEMRAHLVAQNVVRLPRTAGALAPLWLEPRDGAPAPRDKTGIEDADVVLSAFLTGGMAPRPYESMLRHDIVDIWVRSVTATGVWPVEHSLRAALTDKRNWMMGTQEIVESLQWRPLQRLGSDRQGFTHITAFVFERRIAAI